jgi:hypothetical protein
MGQAFISGFNSTPTFGVLPENVKKSADYWASTSFFRERRGHLLLLFAGPKKIKELSKMVIE